MEKCDFEHAQILKVRPSITAYKNSQKKNVTQKGRKVRKLGPGKY